MLVLQFPALSVCLVFWCALATSSAAVERVSSAATFVSAFFVYAMPTVPVCLLYSAGVKWRSPVVLGRLLRVVRPRFDPLLCVDILTNIRSTDLIHGCFFPLSLFMDDTLSRCSF